MKRNTLVTIEEKEMKTSEERFEIEVTYRLQRELDHVCKDTHASDKYAEKVTVCVTIPELKIVQADLIEEIHSINKRERKLIYIECCKWTTSYLGMKRRV